MIDLENFDGSDIKTCPTCGGVFDSEEMDSHMKNHSYENAEDYNYIDKERSTEDAADHNEIDRERSNEDAEDNNKIDRERIGELWHKKSTETKLNTFKKMGLERKESDMLSRQNWMDYTDEFKRSVENNFVEEDQTDDSYNVTQEKEEEDVDYENMYNMGKTELNENSEMKECDCGESYTDSNVHYNDSHAKEFMIEIPNICQMCYNKIDPNTTLADHMMEVHNISLGEIKTGMENYEETDEAGTSDGAKKGWDTRGRGGSPDKANTVDKGLGNYNTVKYKDFDLQAMDDAFQYLNNPNVSDDKKERVKTFLNRIDVFQTTFAGNPSKMKERAQDEYDRLQLDLSKDYKNSSEYFDDEEIESDEYGTPEGARKRWGDKGPNAMGNEPTDKRGYGNAIPNKGEAPSLDDGYKSGGDDGYFSNRKVSGGGKGRSNVSPMSRRQGDRNDNSGKRSPMKDKKWTNQPSTTNRQWDSDDSIHDKDAYRYYGGRNQKPYHSSSGTQVGGDHNPNIGKGAMNEARLNNAWESMIAPMDEEETEEAGTSDGAKKGWRARQTGGRSSSKPQSGHFISDKMEQSHTGKSGRRPHSINTSLHDDMDWASSDNDIEGIMTQPQRSSKGTPTGKRGFIPHSPNSWDIGVWGKGSMNEAEIWESLTRPMAKEDFEEHKHSRDSDGKFSSGGGGSSGGSGSDAGSNTGGDGDKNYTVPEEIVRQIGASKVNGFNFFKYTGIKNISYKNGNTLVMSNVPKNPKGVRHIEVEYDHGQDLYNLSFYDNKGNMKDKKMRGIFVENMTDVIINEMGVR